MIYSFRADFNFFELYIQVLKLFRFFLPDSIKSEEAKPNRDKRCGEDADPHQNAAGALRFKIDKEVGIDQRCACCRNEDRRVKL